MSYNTKTSDTSFKPTFIQNSINKMYKFEPNQIKQTEKNPFKKEGKKKLRSTYICFSIISHHHKVDEM